MQGPRAPINHPYPESAPHVLGAQAGGTQQLRPPESLPYIPSAPVSPYAPALGVPPQTPSRPAVVRTAKSSVPLLRPLKFVALAIGCAAAYLSYTQYEIRQPYEWSGAVEARTVGVGSRVGGRVKSVAVREGQQVSKGEVLVVLDASEIEGRRLIAQAEVDAADAFYEKQSNGARPAEVAQAIARVAAARAAADQSYSSTAHEQAELGRLNSLFSKGAVSVSDREAAQTRSRIANATLAQAGARAKEEDAALKLLTAGTRPEDVRAARAQLAVARAKLAQTEQLLEETNIRSPNDGRVQTITVRPGDILRADARAATLLEAGQLYVRIYVPEPHLGKISVGQQVAVSVDSFPKRAFKARIEHINEVGEFTPRRLVTTEERADEVFAARLALLEGDTELRAGMAAFIKLPKK